MAGTRDIKRQIISVQNTQKVTKAMKMVSAAKMRRANDAMNATKPYAEKIREIVSTLAGSIDEENVFMREAEEVSTIALVIVNSDRGLCGAFNSNITRAVAAFRQSHPDKKLRLYIVGKNAFDFFKKRTNDYEIIKQWTSFGGKISYDTAMTVTRAVTEDFEDCLFQECYIVYNEFKSAATQYPKTSKLLPVAFAEENQGEAEYKNFIFEPNPTMLVEELIPRFVNFSVYHCLLESAAGEHGARMVAMDNATRSADDMIKRLVLNYNKARQAAITTDLLDIVNGAEALK